MTVKIRNSKQVYSGRVFDVRLDEVEYPEGHVARREVVEHSGGAVVVPILPDGRVLLIRQYRHPVGKEVFELPAGKLERGEDPETCARRELEEETGYQTSSVHRLTSILTTPGFCDELLHIFLAESLSPLPHGQRLDPGESTLTVHPTEWQRALDMVVAGTIRDAKTIVGLLLADRRGKGPRDDRP